MADLTLVQAIAKLEALPQKAGQVGVECVKEEFRPHNDTGETIKTFTYKKISNELIFVGSFAKGAYYVQKGRKAVTPKRAKVLHWNETPKWRETFTPYARPAKADDYLGRAAKKITLKLSHL